MFRIAKPFVEVIALLNIFTILVLKVSTALDWIVGAILDTNKMKINLPGHMLFNFHKLFDSIKLTKIANVLTFFNNLIFRIF